jgi:hypothetical protein
MPKSKNKKDHKKRVALRRQKLDEKRRAFYKKLEAQFGEEVAKELSKQQIQSGEEPELNV